MKYLKLLIGKIRMYCKRCPCCDGAYPEIIDCPVCEYDEVPKEYWNQRYISWLWGESMPTFKKV